MVLPKTLQHILDDKVSGSVTLLKRLMIALENELLNPELDPATFISYIEYLRNKMEMFTVVRHFCDELILSHNVSVRNYPANYLNFIGEYKDFWEHVPQLLLNNLLKEVRPENRTVMLHSNSGTIREVFRLLSEQTSNVRIIQTLSAPMEEGRVQAGDLADMGFRVVLIPDAMVAEMMKETDYLILSADQVRKGSIINKTGSLQMVLSAQQFDVPAFVITESRKRDETAHEGSFRDKKHNPAEVLENENHPNISAENYYFEEIPNYLFTKIITEKKTGDLS